LVFFCVVCLLNAFGDLSPICLSFVFYWLSAGQISRARCPVAEVPVYHLTPPALPATKRHRAQAMPFA
jgi:hypothetical protein